MRPLVRSTGAYFKHGRRPLVAGRPVPMQGFARDGDVEVRCPQCHERTSAPRSENEATCSKCKHRWFWRLSDLWHGER